MWFELFPYVPPYNIPSKQILIITFRQLDA